MDGDLAALDFEVHGKVQGVSFRKYALQTANQLKLRGWCKNSERGTVEGHLEGAKPSVDQMKKWLKEVGSPHSKIEKAVFSNETAITDFSCEKFSTGE